MSSVLTRSTFRDDGYEDGRAGRRPSPPDPHQGSTVFAVEYTEGWEQGDREHKAARIRTAERANAGEDWID